MKKLKHTTVLFCLFIFSSCQAQRDSINEEHLALKRSYQKKLSKYLLKDKSLSSRISINDTSIIIYNQEKIEYQLAWETVKNFHTLLSNNPQKAWSYYQKQKVFSQDSLDFISENSFPQISKTNLRGLRIALDPGHIAGSMNEAKMEGKFVEMTLANGKKISFFESEIAWFTAKILKDKLEKLGAEVLLSRDSFGHTAFDEPYNTWYKRHLDSLKKAGKSVKDLSKQKVFFDTFRKRDFVERARRINAFQPHLTLIIHYNVDANNTGWRRPINNNNSMAFVGGSFMKGELEKMEARFNLLRLLLTKDLEKSIEFSDKILENLDKSLNIKPIPVQNRQFFLPKYCLKTEKQGVYARNLTLARKVWGVVCYAEPLYQDNLQEVKLLNQRNLVYQGRKIPKRIEEVAEAYLQGILAYISKS